MSVDANLKDSFVAALKEHDAAMGIYPGRTSLTGAGAGSLPGMGQAFDVLTGKLYGGAEAIGSFTGKLVRNTAGLPDVSNLVSNFGGMFGKFTGLFADGIGGVINYMDESVKNWQEFSGLGLTMSGSAMKLNLAQGMMRESAQEFAETFKMLEGYTGILGRTVSEGTWHFAEFSEQFQRSDAEKQMLKFGFQTKDTNALLALTTRTRYDLDLNNIETQKKLNADVIEIARNMAEISATTGVTRKQQMEGLEKLQSEGRYRAAIIDRANQGDTGYVKAATEAQSAAQQFKNMPTLIDAIQQSITNSGQIYGKTLDTLTYFPQTLEKIQHLGQAIDHGTEEQRKAAIEELKSQKLLEDMAVELRKGSAVKFARVEGVLPRELVDEIMGKDSPVMQRVLAQAGIDLKQPGLNATAQAMSTAKMENAGLATEDDAKRGIIAGQEEFGRQTTILTTQLQQRMKDLSAISLDYMDKFNTEIGRRNDAMSVRMINLNKMISNEEDQFNQFFRSKLNKADETNYQSTIQDTLTGLLNSISGGQVTARPKEGEEGHAFGGTSTVGRRYKKDEDGVEFREDSTNSRIYNNGQTRTMLADISQGMQVFPILAGTLRDIPQMITPAVQSAIETFKKDAIDIAQDPLLEEVKKLNTISEQTRSVMMAVKEGIDRTTRAVGDAGSVYS